MIIRSAIISDTDIVTEITCQTINAIYPLYYPVGAVEFFLKHHSFENIRNDIANQKVYVLVENDIIIATITINEKSVNRLFVLPQFQGNGYGRELMDFAEKKIFEKYETVQVDSSLPAKGMYIKRGYAEVNYNVIEANNGHFLCYDIMQKSRRFKNENL